jgi:hypothetical protein
LNRLKIYLAAIKAGTTAPSTMVRISSEYDYDDSIHWPRGLMPTSLYTSSVPHYCLHYWEERSSSSVAVAYTYSLSTAKWTNTVNASQNNS